MCKQFEQAVATSLSQDRVWQLLSDIQNWVHCSSTYASLRWSGFPWEKGSCILGEILYPIHLHVRYVIEHTARPRTIRFIGHSADAGFAVSTTISLVPAARGTEIRVSAYAVGKPVIDVPGGPEGFLQSWSERFLADFAAFCDEHVPAGAGENKRGPTSDASHHSAPWPRVG